MVTSEQKTLASGASGMMSAGEDALFAGDNHASGGQVDECKSPADVVVRRTSTSTPKGKRASPTAGECHSP